jgi:hypothetical protein
MTNILIDGGDKQLFPNYFFSISIRLTWDLIVGSWGIQDLGPEGWELGKVERA